MRHKAANPGWYIGLVGMVLAVGGTLAAWWAGDVELLGRHDWPTLLLVIAAAGVLIATVGVAVYARGSDDG